MRAFRAFLLLLAMVCLWAGSSALPLTEAEIPDGRYFYLNHHYNASYEDTVTPRDLSGKVAFVSGITHGQGPEIARQLLLAGVATVIGIGTSFDGPPEFIADDVIFYRLDMTDALAVDLMVSDLYWNRGIRRIDIFIGNAGRMFNGYVQDTVAEDFAIVSEENCEGNFRLYHAFDAMGMIDHRPANEEDYAVIMLTASVAHCSPMGGALGPYSASKDCMVHRVDLLQADAVANGWKTRYHTLSPFGVFTNIGHYQRFPLVSAPQRVCRAQTAKIENGFQGPLADLYGPNPYDSTTVVDVGKNYVMMARYGYHFPIGLHTHFVIKADYPLDAAGKGDWDFWCPFWRSVNPLKVAHSLVEFGFMRFYDICTDTHAFPSATPSVTPSRRPSPTRTRKPGKGTTTGRSTTGRPH